jgi:hypothetical protein
MMRYRDKQNQSGQVLLLAVVLMLMIALVGAGFIAVLSANLAQSSRQEDQVAVEKAAMEGINFANAQLQNHPLGADWRPGDSASPTLSLADYDDVELARNWTLQFAGAPPSVQPNQSFYKFKTQDPNANTYFLLNMQDGAFNPANPLSRYLKITSIGRTVNDPGIFKVVTAYKSLNITDYARFITARRSTPGAQGFKMNVTPIGKPAAIDVDADATLKANAAAGATTITVSHPEMFSEGDTIYIGRDPNTSIPSGFPDPNTVGIREPVTVSTISNAANYWNGQIPVSGLAYAHQAGEPIVVGRINAGTFERKVTVGRLTKFVDFGNMATTRITLTSVRKMAVPPYLIQNNDTIYVGTTVSALSRTEQQLTVTNVDTNVTPPAIDFGPLVSIPPNAKHEKGEIVRVFVPSAAVLNPYENMVVDAAGIAPDPFREAEWSPTIIRGGVFSNGDIRFFGSTLLDFNVVGGGMVETPRTISYDMMDNPATPNRIEGSDSANPAFSVGHPSSTAVNVVTNFGTLTGNDTWSRDGQARQNGITTQPLRWVRPQTPPLVAQEGLFSGNFWVGGGYRFLRYEELTKLSDSRRPNAASPTYGEMGYGKGIYVNNFSDVQFARIPSGFDSFPARRQKQTAQWLNPTITDDPGPNGTDEPAGSPVDDIPQWVNNGLEYVPLGAQIILRNDDVVWDPASASFTRMTNLTPANQHPTTLAPHVPGRPVIWIIHSIHPSQANFIGQSPPRDVNGAPIPVWTIDPRTSLTGNPADGTKLYFTSYDYPENGVICAASNVRIKGNLPLSYPNTTTANVWAGNVTLGDRDYNLTIVSGGTIYIEGNILTPKDVAPTLFTPAYDLDEVHNTHVALMAKDHVCLNSTQFYAPFAVGAVPPPPPPNPPLPPLRSFTPTEFALANQVQGTPDAIGHSYWDMPAGSGNTVMRQFSLGEPYLLTGNANTALLAVAMQHGGSKKAGIQVRTAATNATPVNSFRVTNPASPSFPDPTLPSAPDQYNPTDIFLDADQEPLKSGGNYKNIGQTTTAGTVVNDIRTQFLDSMNQPKYDAQPDTGLPSPDTVPASLLARMGQDETATVTLDNTAWFDVLMITRGWMGVNGTPLWQIGNLNDPFTLLESFYQNPLNRPASGALPAVQSLMSQTFSDPLPSVGPPAVSNNIFNVTGGLNELRFSAEPTLANVLGNYRLSRFKMEQYLPGVDPMNSATVYRPTTGLSIRINALIYAQEGSWFIIPPPLFDDAAFNDDARPGMGKATAYRRFNYRVVINGAIVENETADDFPVTGINAFTSRIGGNRNVYTFNSTRWEERLAYPSLRGDPNDVLTRDVSSPPPLGAPYRAPYVWQGIEYRWDPELKLTRWAVEDVLTGNLKPVAKIPKLPLGPDLIFVG